MQSSSKSDRIRTWDAVVDLLNRDDSVGLRHLTDELHPADIASLLERVEDQENRLRLFQAVDTAKASEALCDLPEPARGELLERLSDTRLTALVERLDTDDATDIVIGLNEERRQLLLDRASPETSRRVQELLTYPEDSAGGIMKTELASVPVGTTVGEVTDYIRRHASAFHDIHNVFVVDSRQRLEGLVPLRLLLLADNETVVGEIMQTELITASADQDQEEVAKLFEKYDLVSLPVIDSIQRLVGRITVDDIVDVIEEEATEDILKLVGVRDEPLGPVRPIQMMKSRLPWLLLNLLTATGGALTISMFEETIRHVTVAAGLMTIIAAQGGNAGIQTMTLIVRGLAIGEVRLSQVSKLLAGETLAALANGILLGSLAAGGVYLWRGDLRLSLVMGIAMITNLLIAAVVGSLVPLGLRALRVDPAVSSSVLVITATDILGFFVFLGLLSALV